MASANVYALFFDLVPGFDGVRVPAALRDDRDARARGAGRARRRARSIAGVAARIGAVAGALILLEAMAVPIPINQNSTRYKQAGLAPLPASMAVGSTPGGLSLRRAGCRRLPSSSSFRSASRRSTCATCSTRRYTGGGSSTATAAAHRRTYGMLTESLKDVDTRPERAWQAIADVDRHACHRPRRLVRGRWRPPAERMAPRPRRPEVAAFGSDRVFALSRARSSISDHRNVRHRS